MARKVQIEVVHPVQDPVSGEVLIHPGARYDEGAKEIKDLPTYMLRAVVVDQADEPPAPTPKSTPPSSTK